MKSLLFILIFIPLSVLSQQTSDPIQKLLTITRDGVKKDQPISYDTENERLIIGTVAIPVSVHTYLKHKKTRGNTTVEFALQEGTSITDIQNRDFQRAWLKLDFKSKKSAKDFIRIFKKVAKENIESTISQK